VATRASSIKLNDLSKAIDRAAATSKTKIPKDWIMGRMIRESLGRQLDTNALARSITKEMAPSLPNLKLKPIVFTSGGYITMGFIAREIPGTDISR